MSREETYRTIRIDGQTKVLGVFGYPVEHSLSPAMHNAAIAALGLHYVYIPFSVRPDDVGPAIQSLPRLGIVGVNLTIPHKESVIPFLDEITPEARAVGAVNTVHVVDGKLIGYNTDGDGFMAALINRGFRAEGAKVVVLGAGGAARSVVYRLARGGAQVTIANRDHSRAVRLAEEFNEVLPESGIRAITLDESIATDVESAGLVVNATSVGMHPKELDIPPIPLRAIRKGQFIYDLIYRPIETRLLMEARTAGAVALNGVGMLVNQGIAAFQIWTGVAPPANVMERAVMAGLAEK